VNDWKPQDSIAAMYHPISRIIQVSTKIIENIAIKNLLQFIAIRNKIIKNQTMITMRNSSH